MATDLEDLEVLEVSLVKKPANRRNFCLYKNAEGIPKMHDLTAAILSVPGDAPGMSQIEKRSGLSKEAKSVIADAVKMLAAVKDEMSAGLMKQISDALGVKGLKEETDETEDEESAEPEKELPTESTPEEDEEEAATGSAEKELPTPDEDEDEEKKLMSKGKGDESELYKSQNETADPKLAALFKQVADLQAINKAHEDAKRLNEFITKAKATLTGVPGMTPDAVGTLLSQIDTHSPELAQQVESVFKSTVTQAESAGVFGELGSAQPAFGDGSTAGGKLEGLAKARVHKTGEDYTTAYVKVLDENPELYANYVKEGQ